MLGKDTKAEDRKSTSGKKKCWKEKDWDFFFSFLVTHYVFVVYALQRLFISSKKFLKYAITFVWVIKQHSRKSNITDFLELSTKWQDSSILIYHTHDFGSAKF